MSATDRRYSLSIELSTIALALFLALPKINILNVGGFNAGLRIDDILILAYALLHFISRLKGKLPKLDAVEVIFYCFVLVAFMSVAVGQVWFGRSSLLFPLRYLEYFVFFYMGWRFFRQNRNKLQNVVTFLFWSNVAVALLQLSHVVGGFTVYGYATDVSERVIGLGSGPWELGIVLNLCSGYMLVNSRTQVRRYITFLIATLIILANGSRMALVAQVVILAYYFILSGSAVGFVKRALLFLPVVVVAASFVGQSGVATRSANLANSTNINLFIRAYESIPATEAAPNWGALGVLERGGDADPSWSMRGRKWVYAYKMWLLNPWNTLFGVGMGVFGNALDGGWLRILAETGIFGLLLFIAFLRTAARFSPETKLAVTALAVNMLFIDIHLSYKAMSLLLLFVGYFARRHNLRRMDFADVTSEQHFDRRVS